MEGGKGREGSRDGVLAPLAGHGGDRLALEDVLQPPICLYRMPGQGSQSLHPILSLFQINVICLLWTSNDPARSLPGYSSKRESKEGGERGTRGGGDITKGKRTE